MTSLGTGLDILELLARERRALALGEIAQMLDLAKSGTHRLLATLSARGYVEHDEGGIYRLGIKAWEVGHAVPKLDLLGIARPEMEALAARVDEGTILGVRDGFDIVYPHLVESSQPVRVHARVGERIPAHCTSTGLCLLAQLSDAQVDALLPATLTAVTPFTITDPRELRRELARIRARGYAINHGGWRVEVGGIAVAIFGPDGSAVAGLCVSAPRYRMTRAWLRRVTAALSETAATISDRLARRPKPTRKRA
jgi:DNA-binding IclR family transcriptional regulator